MGTSESRRAKRKVDQFDINGVLIKTYNSLSEASIETKIHVGSICNACRLKYKNTRKHLGNYIWKYNNDNLSIGLRENPKDHLIFKDDFLDLEPCQDDLYDDDLWFLVVCDYQHNTRKLKDYPYNKKYEEEEVEEEEEKEEY